MIDFEVHEMELLPGLYQPRQFMPQTAEQAASKPCCPPHCLGIHLVRVVWKPWNHHSAKFPVDTWIGQCPAVSTVSLLQCKTDHLEAINLASPHFFHLKISCLTWDTVKTTHNILFRMSAQCWQKCNKCEWILSSLLYLHQFNLTSIYSMSQDPASIGRDAMINKMVFTLEWYTL